MLVTSLDGAAAVRRGRRVHVLASPPVVIELDHEDVDVAFLPTGLLEIARRGASTHLVLRPAPTFAPKATLELPFVLHLAAQLGSRIALARERVFVIDPDLSATELAAAGDVMLALEGDQMLIGRDIWDTVAGKRVRRVELALPPAPHHIGAAAGVVWAIAGDDRGEVVWFKLSTGQSCQIQVGVPIDAVASHPASPYLVLTTSRGPLLVDIRSLSVEPLPNAPYVPGTLLAHGGGEVIGLPADSDTPWRISLDGAPASAPRPLPVEPVEIVPPTPDPRDTHAIVEGFELRLALAYGHALRARALLAGDAAAVARFDADLAAIRSKLGRVAYASPMAQLERNLGLSPAHVELVWTVVAATSDPRIGVHLHGLIGSEARRGLSLAAYATVFRDDDGVPLLARELTPNHPLFACRLLEAVDDNASPIFTPIVASQALVAYLAGRPQGSRDVETLALPAALHFDAGQRTVLDRIGQALRSKTPVALVVDGPLASGRRTAIAHAAQLLGRSVVAVDFRQIAPQQNAIRNALAELRRQALLLDAVPLIANVDELSGRQDGELREVGRFLDDTTTVVALTSTIAGIDLTTRLPSVRARWPIPDLATQIVLWRGCLGDDASTLGAELEDVAMRYRLGPGDIERATESARFFRAADGRAALSSGDLAQGVRANIAERLGDLAERIEVKQTWDDLVLSPDILDQIQALVARVRHAYEVYERWGFHRKVARGIGVPALFSGPPGTGKTMVAGIIARELDLEMYQVDLSKVVSKWVGETEKQLSKIFDAADAGHALLLFDEADSLFAKRTEVRGSTDRYANLEVNYLLQRIEAFGGITILTTNLETSIDAALKRRLAAHVVFWTPDEEERVRLWRRMLDTGGAAPLAAQLDIEALARAFPEMTGAHIRNAVLAAAFLAAAEGTKIGQEHLVRAARGEYRTMGRVLR